MDTAIEEYSVAKGRPVSSVLSSSYLSLFQLASSHCYLSYLYLMLDFLPSLTQHTVLISPQNLPVPDPDTLSCKQTNDLQRHESVHKSPPIPISKCFRSIQGVFLRLCRQISRNTRILILCLMRCWLLSAAVKELFPSTLMQNHL